MQLSVSLSKLSDARLSLLKLKKESDNGAKAEAFLRAFKPKSEYIIPALRECANNIYEHSPQLISLASDFQHLTSISDCFSNSFCSPIENSIINKTCFPSWHYTNPLTPSLDDFFEDISIYKSNKDVFNYLINYSPLSDDFYSYLYTTLTSFIDKFLICISSAIDFLIYYIKKHAIYFYCHYICYIFKFKLINEILASLMFSSRYRVRFLSAEC